MKFNFGKHLPVNFTTENTPEWCQQFLPSFDYFIFVDLGDACFSLFENRLLFSKMFRIDIMLFINVTGIAKINDSLNIHKEKLEKV